MAINFTWKVLSLNERVNAMLVEYTNTDTGLTHNVNLSLPLKDQDVTQYIIDNAPLFALDTPKVDPSYATVEVGHTGSASAELPEIILPVTTSNTAIVIVSEPPVVSL